MTMFNATIIILVFVFFVSVCYWLFFWLLDKTNNGGNEFHSVFIDLLWLCYHAIVFIIGYGIGYMIKLFELLVGSVVLLTLVLCTSCGHI